jgi:hypothetical protein
VRSTKQPSKNRDEPWDNGHTQPVTPTSDHHFNGFETFESDLLHLDDIFPGLPSAWATTDTDSLGTYALPSSQGIGTSESSMTTAGTFSSSSTVVEAAVPPTDGPGDLTGRLTHVCQVLEATFRKVTSEHTNRITKDCMFWARALSSVKSETANLLRTDPVGEVFSAFDGFLRVLALDDMTATITSCTPQTPFDEYLRGKQASMAAQCYILCLKLMVSLSEQMLQSLLASPLPTPRSPFANLTTAESTQSENTLRAHEGTFSNASHIPKNLRLGDLYVPPTDSFDHALNSTVNMLQIGSRLLGRIEQLLEIPPELGSGSPSLVTPTEQAGTDQHLRRSLPARLIASIWEDEASITNKCAVTYFRRCRAAILGLTQHHS